VHKFDEVTTARNNIEELYIALASHKYKFDEVTAERDNNEELYVEQQNAAHTALASHKYFENNHTDLKIISVQVETE
jgi:hypothetical protein